MGLSRLSDEQLDALRAIGARGMEPAATALARLMGTAVCLSAQRIHGDMASIPKAVGGPERPVIGIHVKILGDFRGGILIVVPPPDAATILEKLLGRMKLGVEGLPELEASALREVGNILASACLNALGDMLGMTLSPSVPTLFLERVGATVDRLLVDGAGTGEVLPMIETELSGEDGTVWGHVFLLPNPSSLEYFARRSRDVG